MVGDLDVLAIDALFGLIELLYAFFFSIELFIEPFAGLFFPFPLPFVLSFIGENFDPLFGDFEDRPILDEAKLFPVFFILFFFASLDSMNS